MKFISDIVDLNINRCTEGFVNVICYTVGDIMDTLKSASEELYYTHLEQKKHLTKNI